MKKITVLLMIFILCGCQSVTLDYGKLEKSSAVISQVDVIATVKENKINETVESYTLSLENKTDKEYFYGVNFSLEIENEGEWYIVPFNESAAFIEIGYILDAYKTNEELIDLSYFKDLPPGKYRVVKTLSSLESDITVAGEFKIELK